MAPDVQDHDFNERRVATHEAGHAVVVFCDGVEVEEISIRGRGQFVQGHCRCAPSFKDSPGTGADLQSTIRHWEIHVRLHLGGMAAERRLLRACDLPEEPLTDLSWSEDRCQVERWLGAAAMYSSDREGIRARLMTEVESRVADPLAWNAIQMIAQRLLVRRTISGIEARSLFDSARRDGG